MTGRAVHATDPMVFSKKYRHPFVLLLIAFATYYGALVSVEFIQLDDYNLIKHLINNPPLSWKALFLSPNSTYYRPVLDLSFRLDYLVWADSDFGYHQTNLLLHLLNVLLVYITARLLFESYRVDVHNHNRVEIQLPALLSALFFAVNPLLSESICWVSGRSDILAASFVLSSFVLYLLFKRRKKHLYLLLALIAFIPAMMTKETAVALPAVVIAFELFYQENFGLSGSRRIAVFASLLLIAAVTAYLFVKGGSIDTTKMSLAVGEKGLEVKSPLDNVRILLASYGFYFKKLFFPYPLNFAIHRINESFYATLGAVGLTAFLASGFLRRRIYGFFVAWVILTLAPSVAAGMLMLPWTPWAERFLYLPMAGFSMAAGYGFSVLHENYGRRASVCFSLILMVLLAGTEYRIYLWADEIRLWEDTASKTDYGPVYSIYGNLLYNRGDSDKAIDVLEKGLEKGYAYPVYLTLASIHQSRKEYSEYEGIMQKVADEFPTKKNTYRLFADGYLRIAAEEKEDAKKYTLKAIEAYKRYLESGKGGVKENFRIAALYKSIQMSEEAKPFLEKVIELAPGSKYAVTAGKALNELKQNEP